jgi:hypothetical protein
VTDNTVSELNLSVKERKKMRSKHFNLIKLRSIGVVSAICTLALIVEVLGFAHSLNLDLEQFNRDRNIKARNR